MNVKRLLFYFVFLLNCFQLNAQTPQLLPMPQKSSFSGKYVKANLPVREVLVKQVPEAQFQDEAYHLSVTPKEVIIEAVTEKVCFGHGRLWLNLPLTVMARNACRCVKLPTGRLSAFVDLCTM